LGEAVYCGTSNGIYVIAPSAAGGKVIQLRFEPDSKGKLAMTARKIATAE
jgi:hypothetical protein